MRVLTSSYCCVAADADAAFNSLVINLRLCVCVRAQFDFLLVNHMYIYEDVHISIQLGII